MIAKKGMASWKGNLTDGTGTVSTESGVLDETNYSFAKRFEGQPGTNPEELLGAAHAGCFSMALSNMLAEADMTADKIETTATVTLDPSSLTITKSALDLTASIPGADEAAFKEVAEKAKAGCPVSKLYGCEITLDAKLA